MKTSSVVNSDFAEEALVNSIYEEKAISILKKVLIRIVDIIGALIGILLLIPISIYSLINNIQTKTFRLYKLNTDAPFSEFAQFINILVGNMTLVGPRPYTEEEIPKMGTYYNVIIKSKPGLTGVYQISGKRKITFEERLDLDLRYLFNSSIKLNIKILLITIFVTARKDRTEFYDNVIYNSATPEKTIFNYIENKLTLFFKRIIDIVGSLVGIAFLIPLTIIVGTINLIFKENGPLFYSQERIGKNGKKFNGCRC